MFLGEDRIKKVYLGGDRIKSVYLGGERLWQAETVLAALATALVYTTTPNTVVYSGYVTSDPVDCLAGDVISCTVYVNVHANTGGEYGASGGACLQLVKVVDGVETVVYNADGFQMYQQSWGFVAASVYGIGSDVTAPAGFSYTVTEPGSYYLKLRAAVQRAASDQTPTGYAKAYTSEITVAT